MAKKEIASAFDQAAERYDSAATMQRRIADRLLSITPVDLKGRLLDAGCGTGYGSRALRRASPNAQLFTLDIAPGMLERAPRGVCGDIETLPFRDQSLALYWSNLAWQWVDIERAIAEAARALAPGGMLRVATLGPATLHEMRDAFAHADDKPHVRELHHPQDYSELLATCGFRDIRMRREITLDHVATPRDLILTLRDLGARVIDQPRSRGLMGRKAWQRFEDAYEALRTEAGLPVSYDAVYLTAHRPA